MTEKQAIPEGFRKELLDVLGPRMVYDSMEKREVNDLDATDLHFLPGLVVEPETTNHVSALMKLAHKWKIPVTPRASGTGMTGGSLALSGGVCLSMTRMNRIIEIDAENMIAVVQPGLVNLHLKERLSEQGLYYPPDPSSMESSTIGGNVAENAGGPHCLKYGVTRDYILGMEVVLPNGEILRLGKRTRKGVVGYNICDLMIGSEGTLGVITELTLKLIPLPRYVTTMLALFPDFRMATKTISTTFIASLSVTLIPPTNRVGILSFLRNSPI